MNVRVLLLLVVCVLASGCCMPGAFMNPGMMQCCPVRNVGVNPLMSTAGCGPAQFRSFHSNLATANFRNVQTSGGILGVQQCRPVMQSAMATCCPQSRITRQAVCQQGCQPQQAYVPPVYVARPLAQPPIYHAPPAPARPWTLPTWPWKRSGFPKVGCQKCASQRWVPVVNNPTVASGPCTTEGCNSVGPSFRFSGDGCGEEIPFYHVPQQMPSSGPAANLSPVPVPPSTPNVRYFPNSGEQSTGPVEPKSETYFFDPPPAAEVNTEPDDLDIEPLDLPQKAQRDEAPSLAPVIDPAKLQDAVSPASKPAMSAPINPFEDIEDVKPEASLPLESQVSQSFLLIPATTQLPLYIPNGDHIAIPVKSVVSSYVPPEVVMPWASEESMTVGSPEIIRAVEVVQRRSFIRPASYQVESRQVASHQMASRPVASREVMPAPSLPWQSIELQQGFFEAGGRQHQVQPVQGQQVQGQQVQRHRTDFAQSQLRQVAQQAVIRRSAPEEAQQFVPIRRVITRRRQ